MTRVALYARYSSDNQREASIEDQLRLCRLHAERQGWTIVDSYQDRAVSGASLIRTGIQALLGDALRGRFDVVLAEALDRISRDQEDVAGVCDATGRVFGLMPHPEDHIYPYQHPRWTRGHAGGMGIKLFENGLKM